MISMKIQNGKLMYFMEDLLLLHVLWEVWLRAKSRKSVEFLVKRQSTAFGQEKTRNQVIFEYKRLHRQEFKLQLELSAVAVVGTDTVLSRNENYL